MQLNFLNRETLCRLEKLLERSELVHVRKVTSATGATIVDFGVDVTGGFEAGLLLSTICMGTLGKIDLVPGSLQIGKTSDEHGAYCPVAVQVTTDNPLWACMGCQYAGWPVSAGGYYAMASGPIRLNRGREELQKKYFTFQPEQNAVGVLEADQLPSDEVIDTIAEECQVRPENLSLCVAPTHSMAGMMQIVARSVEATMHKLYELEFDLGKVRQAWGTAPLPPIGADKATAIGRSNDSILYGGRVQLWIDANKQTIDSLAEKVPSDSSPDFGRPFKEIFLACNQDFYAIDKMLFSSAQVTLTSTQSGHSKTVGKLMPDLLAKSFQS